MVPGKSLLNTNAYIPSYISACTNSSIEKNIGLALYRKVLSEQIKISVVVKERDCYLSVLFECIKVGVGLYLCLKFLGIFYQAIEHPSRLQEC